MPDVPVTNPPTEVTAQTIDLSPHVQPQTYVTADIPGIGGHIKERPEDFLVDELPLYQPRGEGEHIYLFVQKRNLSTLEMVRVLAMHFCVHPGAIGYAGLKDKAAITRQVVSIHVPGKKIEDFPQVTHERIGVLWADYHTNKLRPGHLAGNRFSVRVRGTEAIKVRAASAVLERLAAVGVPNRIGEQRFGNRQNNHRIGAAIIRGDYGAVLSLLLGPDPEHPDRYGEAREAYVRGDYKGALLVLPRSARAEQAALRALVRGWSAEGAAKAIDPSARSFFVSAFQSAVFNAVLDSRVAGGLLGTLRAGDLAFKHDNRAVFAVDDATLADPAIGERLGRFEVSPSGPMWGGSMLRAKGKTDEEEVAALVSAGITPEDLARHDERSRASMEGQRRPLRVPVIDPEVEGGIDEHGHYVRCAFDLPRGSFATVVLREIIKPRGLSLEDDEGHDAP